MSVIFVLWVAAGVILFLLGQSVILFLVFHKFKALEKTMSVTLTGLAALQAQVAALATAISGAIAELQGLAAQLVALNSEDPAVAALAGQIQSQVTSLNAAVSTAATPPAPPAAPTS